MSAGVVMAMGNLPFHDGQWEQLARAAAPLDVVRVSPRQDDEIHRVLQVAEVAILAGDLDRRHVGAPRLRWIHCDHAGLTKSALPEVFEKGLIVTGSAGRSAAALAEHAMMFMLMLGSNYAAFYEAQKRRQWRGVPGMENLRALSGRTLGLIGLGHTGVELAIRAKVFGMHVMAYRRRDLPAPAGVDELFCADRGETIGPILDRADVIALAINLSDATHHLIAAPELRRMKPTAILVNMARGGVVDEVALVEALRSGEIAGAGLDVFETEPLPAESPLWDAPNTLITPHFTASLPDRSQRSLDIIVSNFERLRTGQPMLNRLMPEDVYTRRPG